MGTNTYTHKDVLRLAHPAGLSPALVAFARDGKVTEDAPAIFKGFEAAQKVTDIKGAVKVLKTYKNLPWEAFPTAMHNEPLFWKTLFYNGQLQGQALIRNVVRLSRNGALDDMQFAADVAAKIDDVDMLRKTRLHPINILNALVTYKEGQIPRGTDSYMWYTPQRKKDWQVNSKVMKALDSAFTKSFQTITPANKRTLVAVDVSGSMGCKANGLDLTCAQVAAAVAMTVARTEPYSKTMGFASSFRDLGIDESDSLAQVMRKTGGMTFGSTDCSAPMTFAQRAGIEVDTFVVITDNETYAGRVKPSRALKGYREATGIDARLAVLGVASTKFTIADPEDRGMMDFAGFDSAAPAVLADFSAGRL